MTDILDAAGVKIGEARPGQDLEAQRTHPVPVIDPVTGEPKIYEIPAVDSDGNPEKDENGNTIIVEKRAAVEYVPINYQRAKDQLAAEGMEHVGNGVLVDVEPVAE